MADSTILQLGKVPPQATDIEANILGACMADKHGLLVSCRMLTPKDFYLPAHRIIFETIQDMHTKSLAVDLTTVLHMLGPHKDEVGGVTKLIELTDRVVGTSHIETWCTIVLDKSVKRNMIEQAHHLMKLSFEDTDLAINIMTEAHKAFMELSALKSQGYKDHQQIAKQAILEMTTPTATGISGIPLTGIYDLDYQMNGGEPGDLILIAARPSMGKSMLFNTIICNLDRLDIPCLAWGLEMDEGQNFKMYVSNMGDLDYSDVKRGRVLVTDKRLNNAYERFTTKQNVHFIGQMGVNVGQIRAKCTEMIAEHGIKVILIDHGRLIRKNMLKGFNDIEEISLITSTLKQLGKEMMIPVVLLWQLSRASETQGGDKRPMMSHMRGSGTLEEDADKIALIHRPAYYNKGLDDDTPKDLAEIDCVKVRGGETGLVLARFRPERARFEKWSGDESWEMPTHHDNAFLQ